MYTLFEQKKSNLVHRCQGYILSGVRVFNLWTKLLGPTPHEVQRTVGLAVDYINLLNVLYPSIGSMFYDSIDCRLLASYFLAKNCHVSDHWLDLAVSQAILARLVIFFGSLVGFNCKLRLILWNYIPAISSLGPTLVNDVYSLICSISMIIS